MKIVFLSDFLPKANLLFSDKFSEFIECADLVVFNLEGSPLTNSIEDVPNQIMSFEIKELDVFLNRFGKDKFLLALANNHILDNGISGFDHLVQYLENHHIKFFGTKERPYFKLGNLAILNFVTAETVADYTLGRQKLNYLFYKGSKINKQIKEMELKTDDYLVMYPHWGRDMDTKVFKTYDNIIKTSKEWFIFGHHPHVISGLHKRGIYSMGNTFIPHPYYYKKYPATCYGLIVLLETDSFDFSLMTSNVIQQEENFLLDVSEYVGIPDEVSDHGEKFSPVKKAFLKIFECKGNSFDNIKLSTLQGMRSLFRFKYKLMNNNKK